MKILVTGGAGAVGSNLIEALIKKGYQVVSWDNYSAGKESNHVKGAKYIRIDTSECDKVGKWDFDLVYHLGEYSKIAPSFNDIDLVFNYNIQGSYKLLRQCVNNNTPVVYAGSSTKLSYPGELGSPYALFKSTISKLVKGFGEWFGLKYNICYFYNVYGPKTDTWGNEWQTVINIFKNQKNQNLPLTITGDGTQRRDFTHVDDIVKGLILAGQNICNKEFQLGTGKDYSILEIAKAFDHYLKFIPPRKGERPKGQANIKFTQEHLGYKPKHNIIDYIKSL